MPDSEIERYERDEAQDGRRAAVDRLLRRLDGRERRIIVNHNGIGGVPEQTLRQIAMDLGISKERVRQIEQRSPTPNSGFSPAGNRPSSRISIRLFTNWLTRYIGINIYILIICWR